MTESTTTREPVEVHVAGADQQEAARLLLQAARATGHPIESVAGIAGGFLVPYEVAVEAGAVKGDRGMETTTPTEAETAAHPEVTGDAGDVALTGSEDQTGSADDAEEGSVDGVETVAATEEQAEEQTSEPEILRGEALEQALKDRGLSTDGLADEKRARVAEYDARRAADPGE